MQCDVTIGMGNKGFVVGNAHAAQHQVIAFTEFMHVETVADAEH